VAYRAGVLRLALISSGGTRANDPPPNRTLPSGIDLLHYHLPLLFTPLARLEEAFGWPLPWMTSLLEHPVRDGFWNQTSAEEAIPDSVIPVQILSGYYDFFHHDSVQDFERLRRRKPSRPVQLILGPWTHGGNNRTRTQDVDFGPDAAFDDFAGNLEWFDRFVKQAANTPYPLVRYFSMGDNKWFQAAEWPPRGTAPVSFYLHAGSQAGAARPADENPDTFLSDPAKPFPSTPDDRPGISRAALWSPMDLTRKERRNDVLVYDSRPLPAPLRFAGPVRAEIWGESDTPDADWLVRVIDVRPDGFAMGLAHGVVRALFRNSESRPEIAQAGRVYKFDIDLGSVAARLDAGHRLRIEVTGGSFPMYDRNLNTGKGPFDAQTRVARQTLHHDSRGPSRIILPVFP
jgi:putative CocE/NonD family hydrolase